jgi:hypothetical protein
MPCVVITGGPGVGKTTLLAELRAQGYATVAESARAIMRSAARKARALVPNRLRSPERFFVATLSNTTLIPASRAGSSSIGGLLRHWACSTRLRQCLHLSSRLRFGRIHFTRWCSSFRLGQPSTQLMPSAIIHFPGSSMFTASLCGGTVRAAMPYVKYLACRLPHAQSSCFERSRMTPPNPSFHPTCYSGLRPLPQAGELKR